jgi:hypothetical protein
MMQYRFCDVHKNKPVNLYPINQPVNNTKNSPMPLIKDAGLQKDILPTIMEYYKFQYALCPFDVIYSILIFSIGISRIGILHWLHTLCATLPAQNASIPDFP